MADCPICKNTWWVGGFEEWGVCACVSPADILRRLDEFEAKPDADDVLDAAKDHLQRYLAQVGSPGSPLRTPNPDLAALVDLIIYRLPPGD